MDEDDKGNEVHGFVHEEAVEEEEVVIPGSCLSDTETWRLRPAFISSLPASLMQV